MLKVSKWAQVIKKNIYLSTYIYYSFWRFNCESWVFYDFVQVNFFWKFKEYIWLVDIRVDSTNKTENLHETLLKYITRYF